MPRMTLSELQAYEARRKPGVIRDLALREIAKDRMSESDLHSAILNECQRRGWIALHGTMGERTGRTIGEPDFTIIADAGRVFFVECKSATGKLRPEQAALAAWARKLGHTIYVVRSISEFVHLTTSHENPTSNHAGGVSA